MVHYIRFLKAPFICSANKGLRKVHVVKALITITTDLGDDFFAQDLLLDAEISVSTEEQDSISHHSAFWKGGSRVLWIEVDAPCLQIVEEPWRFAVRAARRETSLRVDVLSADAIPEVFSAWSYVSQQAADTDHLNRIERRFMLRSGNVLSILEDTGESIARHIWDAGIALVVSLFSTTQLSSHELDGSCVTRLLQDQAASSPRNVLELGSGCGIVGIALAQSFPNCNVLLTDLPEAMDILGLNIHRSKPAKTATLAHSVLDWEKPIPADIQRTTFDLVLVSDCTYNADSIPALVDTISAIASISLNVAVVVSLKCRHPSEAIFFELMAEARFVQIYHTDFRLPNRGRVATGDSSETINILEFKRRSSSQVTY
ncbi:MAG: hypothetical protein Q9191_003740 [Dirinaria sp. TL-2023a]